MHHLGESDSSLKSLLREIVFIHIDPWKFAILQDQLQ